jgi:AsmA protein
MVRWIAAAVAAVLVLLIAVVVAVPYVVDTPRVQSLISHSATQALGRPVQFRSLSVRVLPLPAIRLTDLEVGEDPRFGTKPFLTIGTGSLRLHLLPLLHGRVEFGELILERPQIAVIQDPTGRLNVATLGAAPGPPPSPRPATGRTGSGVGVLPVVSRIQIVDGTVSYASGTRAGASAYRLDALNLKLEGIGASVPVQFRGQARLSPGGLALTIADGRLAVSPGRPPVEAPLSARVTVASKNLAGLAGAAGGPAPQIGGSLRGTFTVSGTLGAPRVTGQADFTPLTATQTRAACPEPHRRTLTLDLVRLPVAFADDVLTSRPLTTKLGPGTISTGLRVSLRDGALVRLSELSIQALPLGPLLVDFLCQGYAVTGPLDLTGEASTRPAALLATLSGSGHFRIGPGKVVGPQALKLLGTVMRVGAAAVSLLNVDISPSLFDSPLDFDSITGSYTIRDGVITTNDLRYASRIMQLTAAGRYGLVDARVNVDLTLKTGRAVVAARVVGSAAAPSIRVNPGTLLPVRGSAQDIQEGLRDLLKRLK